MKSETRLFVIIIIDAFYAIITHFPHHHRSGVNFPDRDVNVSHLRRIYRFRLVTQTHDPCTLNTARAVIEFVY